MSVDRMTFDPTEAQQETSGLDAIVSRLEFTGFESIWLPTKDGFSLPSISGRLLAGSSPV